MKRRKTMSSSRRIEALYRLTDRLYRAQTQEDVHEAALEAIITGLHCDRASILLFDGGGVMRFVAWQGLSEGYRHAVEGHSPWRADDPDPQPVCVHDVADCEMDAALKRTVLAEGIEAAAFVPLCADGRLIGKFMAYFDAPHGFADDEIDLSLTIARQLAFAIHRARTEAALREADRRKDEFLAVLAHELRNPLAPITNAVHLLRRERGASPLQQEAVSILSRQAAQLTRLVNDLLEVSRITTGRVQLRREWVPLADVVDGAVQSVRSLVDQHAHQLRVAMPPQPVWVHGDAARLEQVLVNLLNNAAKYTLPGGRIDLSVAVEAGNAVVGVRDTGMGIEPALLPRVFELFTQAEKSLHRSHGGLGVGLSLVRNLVEMHGGSVDARSEPGRGSEFIVRLPAASLECGTA
jgi:signal transduction histidine kinase